jgi:DNA-binding transcriptional LysR family regulator
MATRVDFNLLPALDALLREGSVSRAAERAHLTVPAMSRALGRLRAALGDELLVRAGRSMALTPTAEALRGRVRAAAAEASAVLAPPPVVPLEFVDRTFVVRCGDAVAALLVAPLVAAAKREAPGVRLRFVHEGDEDAASLREGRVDLDIGVLGFAEPELRRRQLARDRFVGVVRPGHPLLAGRATAKRFAAQWHVAVSRRGRALGPIDEALRMQGLARTVAATVPDFLAALHAVRHSDLVSAVPGRLARAVASDLGVAAFVLPVDVPEIAVAMAWHPRFDAEPAHRWLRGEVRAWVARGAATGGRGSALSGTST